MDENSYLQQIVGCTLSYGLKSPDLDLYDFGFTCKLTETSEKWPEGAGINFCYLHVVCPIKFIISNESNHVSSFDKDSSYETFRNEIKRVLGATVKRVAMSDKNDLWLDLGTFWLVFITYEDSEESWRFFTSDEAKPHLVASNAWVHFVE